MSSRIARKNIAQLALQIRLAGLWTSSLYILFKSFAYIQNGLRMHGHGKWDAFFIPYHAEKPNRIFKSVYGMVFQHINCWYKKASHFHHVHSQAILISLFKAFEQIQAACPPAASLICINASCVPWTAGLSVWTHAFLADLF
jgi:hypothetical protein